MTSVLTPNLFAEQHVFVAGGTRGINLEIARRFGQLGASVTVLGRDAERARVAEAELKSTGARVQALTADVRDFAALSERIATAVSQLGPIDVLINGAAGNFVVPAAALSSNGFRAVMDIDLLGTFHGCRAAFEHLRKPGARVVNISATQGQVPTPFQAHVCAAKAGVEMLTRTLALEWGGAGVRVNAVAPGPIDDTEGMARLTPTEDLRARVVATIPVGRFGTKAEVAELVAFICSPAAAFIHGAVIACDGGQALGAGSLGLLSP